MTSTAPSGLPAGVPGDTFLLDDARAGRLQCYAQGPAGGPGTPPPVVLVHSVNAAGCAYEVRPLYEHLARTRPTYALDLPGFGRSDRSDRPYTIRLMTDAVVALVREVRRRHGGAPVDVLGLSLGSEFVARAAVEDPAAYRTVALLSPTGLSGTRERRGPAGTARSIPGLHGVLAAPLWGPGLFALLTRPKVVRYFLERTWGGKNIDEGLWAYDCLTVKEPGAHHAPLHFLSGDLFANDVTALHEALPGPVWLAHGVRGDFVDYRGAAALKSRPGWHFDVFQTGALPHFEVPEAVFAAYQRFLAAAP
jgi:pimeloyl-ACP methyl ester carboxylesterase